MWRSCVTVLLKARGDLVLWSYIIIVCLSKLGSELSILPWLAD